MTGARNPQSDTANSGAGEGRPSITETDHKSVVPMPSVPVVRFVHSKASVLLDAVRGLSALAVLGEHWRLLYFVTYPEVSSHRWIFAIPYLLCSAGHQAVVIFFVLSGYLVSGSVFRMFERGSWSWQRYGVHRLLRLWIVLIPGLAFAALWDQAGMYLQRPAALLLYAGQSDHLIVPNVHLASGVGTWFGNLFFLQRIRVPTFGSDQALWSLANELWYYVLFPSGLIALRRGTRPVFRIVSLVLFIAVALFVGRDLLQLFPIWLLGTLLAVCPAPKLKASARWIAAVMYVAIFYGLSRTTEPALIYRDYVLGVATFLFLWILLSARSRAAEQAAATRGSRTLARFSYTLYVAHMPLLVLFAALVVPAERWQPTAGHLAVGLGIVLLVIGFSFALASVTEFKTDVVRSRVERLFGLQDAA
jgi:peptidoglycan/LPS O-acetylase OafA/YrhL